MENEMLIGVDSSISECIMEGYLMMHPDKLLESNEVFNNNHYFHFISTYPQHIINDGVTFSKTEVDFYNELVLKDDITFSDVKELDLITDSFISLGDLWNTYNENKDKIDYQYDDLKDRSYPKTYGDVLWLASDISIVVGLD